VPFARYVLDWENELTFPFKRYQIQPARRGERSQRGRFRELRQCDIDVIWKEDEKSDYLFYDAEVIVDLCRTINDILSFGKIDDTPVFHINNKKIINGLLLALFKTDDLKKKVSTLIDKYTKIGEEKFRLSLKDLSIKEKEIDKVLEFMHMNIENEHELAQLQ
jgi:histidyl-tRNA synthetase